MAEDLDKAWEEATRPGPRRKAPPLKTTIAVREPSDDNDPDNLTFVAEDLDKAWEEATPLGDIPGKGRSFVLGVGQGGTWGYGDEIADKAVDLMERWSGASQPARPGRLASPELRAGIEEAHEKTTGRRLKKSMEREAALAAKHNPKQYWGGELTGGIGSTIAGGMMFPAVSAAGAAAKELPKAARLLKAIQTGARGGAVYGLGKSEADLEKGEYGKAAVDTAAGTVAGATGGFLGERYIAPILAAGGKPLANLLEKLGVNMGRRVLTDGADQIPGHETIRSEAVKEALDSGAVTGSLKKTIKRLDEFGDEAYRDYQGVKADLESHGVEGPVAKDLAAKFRRRGEDLEHNTMDPSLPREWRKAANRIEGLPYPTDTSWVSPTLKAKGPIKERLGLSQMENNKSSLQKRAKYGDVKDTPRNQIFKEQASMARQANEDSIAAAGRAAPEGSPVRELAEKFVPVKQRLGRLNEAHEVALEAAKHPSPRARGVLPATARFFKESATAALANRANAAANALRRGSLPTSTEVMAAKNSGVLLPDELSNPEMEIRAMIEALAGGY